MRFGSDTSYEYQQPGDMRRLAAIRQAGQDGDRAQIPAIMDALANQPFWMYPYTAIQALARLGATEALPLIEAVIQQNSWRHGTFASVAKARLLAESRVQGMTDRKAQAAAKVEHFAQQLSGTSQDFPAWTAAFYAPKYDQNGNFYVDFAHPPVTSVEEWALRQLADIVYHGSYQDYAALPVVTQTRFGYDEAAGVKAQLAPLSREQRVKTIIDDLAQVEAQPFSVQCKIQLAINEGRAATRPAAARLQQIFPEREGYSRSSIEALFEVIIRADDQEQMPVIAQFRDDPEFFVRLYAESVSKPVINLLQTDIVFAY